MYRILKMFLQTIFQLVENYNTNTPLKQALRETNHKSVYNNNNLHCF